MLERVQLSSVSQFAEFAKKHPAILNIGSLSLLKEPITKTINQPRKGCNCSRSSQSDLSGYRPQYEAAMSMLSSDEREKLKSILNTQKLCYYVKTDKGQIKNTCF